MAFNVQASIMDGGSATSASDRYSAASTTEWGVLSGYYTSDFNSTDPENNIKLKMNDGTTEYKQAWADFSFSLPP